MQFLPTNLRPSRAQIESGLASVQVLGRLQWLVSPQAKHTEQSAQTEHTDLGPAILVDVAHNPAAVEKVLAYLAEVDCSSYARIIAVFGVMADKDWPLMLDLLSKTVTHWVPVQSDDARALAHPVLVEALRGKGQALLTEYVAVDQLVTGVKQLADDQDLVLVLGSFAVVGPFLQQFFA
jgi:folylpolyglutamate synthase/dihydropteroate synthase